MLAANGSQPFLEPILCMEEKPVRIVKKYKSTKRLLLSKQTRTKQTTNSKSRIKPIRQLQNDIKIVSVISLHKSDEENVKNNTNDDLFTSPMLVKYELNEENVKLDAEDEQQEDEDKDFCLDDYTEDEEDGKKEESEEKEFDDDEPLISLSKKLSRKPYKKKNTKMPSPSLKSCPDSCCKLKCATKYNNRQRLDIFHYYWQLSKERQVNFIREHIRKQLSQRSHVKTVRHNCCYFLKSYKIENVSRSKKPEEIPSIVKYENENSSCSSTEDLTKVCRIFFYATLRISDQAIKEAFKGFELKPERIALPLRETDKAENTNLAKQIPKEKKVLKLYVDPETGALTDTKPKKKYKRRKRGEPPPKRFPKPVRCAIRCKFKCYENFSEEDRVQMCDTFWSLDLKRRKDYILSRVETEDVKAPTNPEFRKSNRPLRSYQTKFYLRCGPKSENTRVCKHFLENTLRVNPKFVDNTTKFSDKKTVAYTRSKRRRGCKVPHNKTSAEIRQTVLDHINSYPFWIPNKKSKIKYLHYSLAIKKMHNDYKKKCLAAKVDPLSPPMYCKIFHEDFRILFLSNPHPKKGRGYNKTNPNICSDYTGSEDGGCWVDSKGIKLDLEYINPALTLDVQQNN